MQLIAVVLFWNLIVMSLFGFDKYKAKQNQWRVSERFLLGCALLFGAFGAFLGMRLFHHKTRHNRFRIGVPLMLAAQLGLILFVAFYF